ncbi:MAG: hypothetical protein IPK87_10630 [Planctomycetes bacterium]|nr:hypothetical protein [Planctomycetota bacterium]
MITGCEDLLTQTPPHTADADTNSIWAVGFKRLQNVVLRMDLAFEREFVEDALAGVKATQHAATNERNRMAEACLSATAPQVRLRISQPQLENNDRRGMILCEMRQQIDLLSIKLLNEELGDESPLKDDFVWRHFGKNASEERLIELREMLRSTEPRKRSSSHRRRRRRGSSDGEIFESYGENYERYENNFERTDAAPKPQVSNAYEMLKARGEQMNRLAADVQRKFAQSSAGRPGNGIGEAPMPLAADPLTAKPGLPTRAQIAADPQLAAMFADRDRKMAMQDKWVKSMEERLGRGDPNELVPEFPAELYVELVEAAKVSPQAANFKALVDAAMIRRKQQQEDLQQQASGGRPATPAA